MYHQLTIWEKQLNREYYIATVFFNDRNQEFFFGAGAFTKITVGHEAAYAKKLFLSHNGARKWVRK